MKQAAHGIHRVLVAVNLTRLKHLPLDELQNRHLTAELVTPHKRAYIEALETLIDRREPQPDISDAEVDAALQRVLQAAQDPSMPHNAIPSVPPQARHTRRPRRGLIAIAAIITVTTLLMVGALASRLNLFTYLFGSEITTIQSGVMVLERGEYKSLDDALLALGLTETGPKWIPTDYVLESVSVRNVEALDEYDVVHAWYAKKDSDGLGISIKVYNIRQGTIDIILAAFENGEHRESIRYNGIEHQITENLGQYRALWESMDGAVWNISGDMTMTELEQIIKSIYKEK